MFGWVGLVGKVWFSRFALVSFVWKVLFARFSLAVRSFNMGSVINVMLL